MRLHNLLLLRDVKHHTTAFNSAFEESTTTSRGYGTPIL